MAISLVSQYLYVNFVDIEWFAQMNIAAQGDMSPAEEEQMKAFFTRDALLWSSVIGAFLFFIVNAIYAVYVNLMTRSTTAMCMALLTGMVSLGGFQCLMCLLV